MDFPYVAAYSSMFDGQSSSMAAAVPHSVAAAHQRYPTTVQTALSPFHYNQPDSYAYYQPPLPPPYTWMGNFAETLLSIEWEQCCKLSRLTFRESGIAFVYNPLEYAFETHADYVRKYCQSSKAVVFLGMNPGPFGMAQNGVSD